MILSSLRALTQNRDTRWIVRRLAGSPHRLSKLRNIARVQWSKWRKDPRAGRGLPLIVSVEPTNSCNMKCPMCPTGLERLTRKKGMMDLERFTALVDELKRSTLIMTFWGWGESTLNPELFDMIRIAHERGIFTMLTMNGTNIDADAILDSGLDYLVVSMDGTREESYAPVRVGGNLESAKDGVARLKRKKQERGLDRPLMNMGFIVTKLNEGEVPSIQQTAQEFGFDAARPKYLHTITKDCAETLRPEDPKLVGTVGVSGPGRALETGIPGVPNVNAPNGCGILWEYAMVYWDGKMVPCCYDWDAEESLGNAFESGFAEVWHGDAYAEFRRRVTYDKASLGLCRECEGGDIQVFFSDSFLLNGTGQ